MKILAFDTCCGIFSITILSFPASIPKAGQGFCAKSSASLPVVLYSYQNSDNNQQAAQLVPNIEKGLQVSGISYSDLSHLAVTVGPGSFTGIRIGIAAAQGISLATGIPVISITTLEALAYSCNDQPVKRMVTIEAGSNQYYCQLFQGRKAIELPTILNQDQIPDKVEIIGALESPSKLPNALDVAYAAIDKQLLGTCTGSLLPLYIRAPYTN